MANKKPTFAVIDPSQYGWPVENLAREDEAKRDRTGIYQTDLLPNALAGIAPTIHQPIMASTPDDEDDVAYVIDGHGRIASALAWMLGEDGPKTPEQRFQDAMSLYGDGLKLGGKKLPKKDRDALTLENLEKSAVFSQENTSVDPALVVAAFKTDVPHFPVLWYDVEDEDDARDIAVKALVQREGATMADRLKHYESPAIRMKYPTPDMLAKYFHVTMAIISTLGQFSRARLRGALHPLANRIFLLHQTPATGIDLLGDGGKQQSRATPHNSPFTLNGLKRLLQFESKSASKLLSREGKFIAPPKANDKGIKNDPDGSTRIEFSYEEQEQALQTAINAAWEEMKAEGNPPAVSDTLSDAFLRNIQFKDFKDALESMRVVKSADNAPAKDEDRNKPRKPELRPRLADVLNFVESARWKGTRHENTMAALRDFLYGFTGPLETAQAIESSKLRPGKVAQTPENMQLPTAIAAKIAALKTADEGENEAQAEGESA